MESDYSIHLNFLPITSELPSFKIYRKKRNDGDLRPAPFVQSYSLPIAESIDERELYWVGIQKVDDSYQEFIVQPHFNNDLTRWMIFESLCSKVQNVSPKLNYSVSKKFGMEIQFSMKSYSEGEEQLVIQPYLLKATHQFGLISDFHFRKNQNINFSRRIQQLSLSLDKNYRRNLDYYTDRLSKISRFIAEKRNVLSPCAFLGSERQIQIGEEFVSLKADRLRGKMFVFAGGRQSRSQYMGLKEFGPLSAIESVPKVIFMFKEQDRQAARTLAIALKGSKQKEKFSFPGFETLFRTPLDIDSHPFVLQDYSEQSMRLALEAIKQRNEKNIVPVLVVPDDDNEIPYLDYKAIFAHAGIAGQACTLKVIQDENTLKWATANIALQLFCKGGGLPWKVQPVSELSLIIGISQSHKIKHAENQAVVEKYFAFSVLTDSSGLFQKIQVLGEASQEEDYLAQLRENLIKLLKDNAKKFSQVVIHTSFKLKQAEIDAIQKTVKDVSSQSKEQGDETKFAVVKINHKSRFFGGNRTVNSLVPFEGTKVKLGPSEYLIWFEGIFPDKLTVTKAFPGPTHVQFLRISDEKQMSEEVLLQELVNLSGANWRGFNAKSTPVSVFYCHLVAELVQNFHHHNLPLPQVEVVKPWFL